jgi:hypothetical protein
MNTGVGQIMYFCAVATASSLRGEHEERLGIDSYEKTTLSERTPDHLMCTTNRDPSLMTREDRVLSISYGHWLQG